MTEDLPDNLDLAFIGTFTQGAQLAYALSARLRSEGTITVLGGPHARCYPEDAQQYFDYVVGFTDKAVIQEILSDCSQFGLNYHRCNGIPFVVNVKWFIPQPFDLKACAVFLRVSPFESLGGSW